MPHSVYDTDKILDLKEKFITVCETEGGKVTKMKDGSITCELGNNKIKLSKFADYMEIERDVFKDEAQVKLSLYGLEEIRPSIGNEHAGWFVGEKNGVKWQLFIRYGKIWFSSEGIKGSLAYPITKPHQVW